MEHQFNTEVLFKLKQKRRKKFWKRVLSMLMCLVVFCTTYALILPAITKETETFCGKEPHTHTEDCYLDVLLCENHAHDESCFGETRTLICPLEETEGHTHGEACGVQTETVLICEQEEAEAHSHTEQCGVQEQVLSCGLEETADHSHTQDCYTSRTTYVCGLEETAGHSHEEGCRTEVTTYLCGQEEVQAHSHTEDCYHVEREQICTIETESEHEQHTESCYEKKLSCELEEHTHGLSCYADPNADLESAVSWEATLPELSGEYAADVLAIAKSQLGYTESAKNYIVAEDQELKGYTRYGAWYGAPYDDWCAMFVSFCLHYAGVEGVPMNAHCPGWADELRELNLYNIPSDYVPKAGDIIFFDWEKDGLSDHVGLVKELVDTNVITIEGDSGNRVAQNKYELHDDRIVGYGVLTQPQPQPPAEEPVEDGEIRVETPPAEESTNAWADLVITGAQEIPEVESSRNPLVQTDAEPVGELKVQPLGGSTSISDLTDDTAGSVRATGTPLDLAPYINTVVMYDSDGKPIPSGAVVTEGDLIEFKIEYTITGQQLGVMNGETVTVNSNTLTYDLPKTFQIVQSDSGKIRNSFGQEVGTYVIDNESGKITMTFTDDYVEQNASGMQIHGYISFFSTVKKVTQEDDEHQDFKFTDEITLGVIIEEKVEAVGDLSIEKQKADINGEEIVYEIKVTSTNGTNGPITVTDQMSTGLTFREGISVLRGDGSPVQDARFEPSADGSSFSMTLPEMAPGDSYTIRYSCAADIDLLGADMTVQNTATVTGKDSQNKELKDRVTVDHTFDVLKKTGEKNEDGTITWTITINQAKADISGWILDDRMNNVTYTGAVTIRDSRGNVVANNVRLPYTFPDGSTDTYTLTYTAPYDYGSGSMVYNTAILKDKDTEITIVTGVDIGTPITKTGTAEDVIRDANGTYLLPITWTVTIDATGAPIPAGSVLQDFMEDWNSSEMYMTYAQLMAAYENIKAALNSVGSGDPARFTATEHMPGMGQNSALTYDYNALVGNVGGTHDKVYEMFTVTTGGAIPKGSVLTFTYQTYGTFANNVVAGAVFTNQFVLNQQYYAKGKVELKSGAVKATKSALRYYDPEVHGDWDWYWNITDWSSTEGSAWYNYKELHDSYLAWSIELSVPLDYWGKGNVVLFEDLPDGVSVKSLKLPFNSNVPTTPLYLENPVPGQTYQWEFLLYTAEQYYYWDRQNGQPVSIEIKYTEDRDLEITIPNVIFETMAQFAKLENTHREEKDHWTEWYGYLYIFTQIDEDFEWTPQAGEAYVYVDSFKNQFTLKDENGDVLDVGSQTQVITKDESDGIIKKTATTEEDNIITYSVVLNAYKKDLIENAAALAIHDELTYRSTEAQPLRLRLVPGSVKLYKINVKSDGSYEKLGEVPANYKYEETSYVQYGITNWSHTIDLNIPDSTSLLLEYSYKASGGEDVTHSVSNVCEITGVGQGGLEGNTKVEIEVKDATAQADTSGVMICKVDANSDGIYLEKAKFHIYIWNEDLWNEETQSYGKYIIVHHPNNGDTDFSTDSNGMIVLDKSTMDEGQFAYNTAYYIVEVKSPDGYYISPEPYYFYIKHNDTQKYPSCIPDDFTGHALTSGDIIYRQNVSEFTEITVEKYWKDFGGKTVTVTGEEVTSVTLELWQRLQGGDPDGAVLFGTYTMVPDENGNWTLTITGLPKATKNSDGTRGTNYLYYIKEVDVGGYELESAENNSGINSGTIRLVNKKAEGYLLPNTGGAGTQLYTTAGLLLMLTSAAFLVYNNTKRRKEVT